MFCSNCGKELPDSVAFCTNCGAKLKNTDYTQAGNTRAPWTQQYNPVTPAQPVQPALPMNWYKFLIYFSLFAGAVVNFISGILNLTGGNYLIYGVDPETVYSAFDGMHTLDIGFGIVYFALIPFALIARSSLAKFKKDAPNMFYIYHGASMIVSVIYNIFSVIITGGSVSEIIAQALGTAAGVVLFVALNIIYFNKRKHLFVN